MVRRPFGPNCCPLVLPVPGSSILGREGSQVPGQVLSCVSWEPRAQGLPLTVHSMLCSDRAAGGPEKPATLSSELHRQDRSHQGFHTARQFAPIRTPSALDHWSICPSSIRPAPCASRKPVISCFFSFKAACLRPPQTSGPCSRQLALTVQVIHVGEGVEKRGPLTLLLGM